MKYKSEILYTFPVLDIEEHILQEHYSEKNSPMQNWPKL